jgi:hypothetical protein
MKPPLKVSGPKRLKQKHDEVCSTLAVKLILRRYIMTGAMLSRRLGVVLGFGRAVAAAVEVWVLWRYFASVVRSDFLEWKRRQQQQRQTKKHKWHKW